MGRRTYFIDIPIKLIISAPTRVGFISLIGIFYLLTLLEEHIARRGKKGGNNMLAEYREYMSIMAFAVMMDDTLTAQLAREMAEAILAAY